ncbi:RecF/RecN/SMC N terminal domain-containing protein [Phlebopus sp. FC_14]|nr:RecF/RecN/SMC N terminal domain-containing protein [Phlebopus sp. FC_14]
MPPRRSSRTRSSVEPTSAVPPASNTSKRKRGQSVTVDDVDNEVAEKENVSKPKPASRGRKLPSSSSRASVGPSVPPKTGRRTARRQLQEVMEVDEDVKEEEVQIEAPPARKKSRKSLQSDEEEVKEEEEEQRPVRRARKGSVIPKAVEISDEEKEEDGDETQDVKRVPRTRRSSAKPPSSRKTGRSTRKPKKIESDIDEEEGEADIALSVDEDDSDDAVRARGGRKPSGKRTTKQSQARKTSTRPPKGEESSAPEQSEVDEPQDDVPTPRPHTSMPLTPSKNPGNTVWPTQEDDVDDLDGFDETYKGSPIRMRRRATNNSSPKQSSQTPMRFAPVVEDEEEHSLLEPRIRAPPRSQSQLPPVEEPKGPKSRLVIHKMALINFKSYAGRQEIGPFHKSFSAIVGPNGSGKSNTIDALLFVFGYRASKMRQAKLSELIHNSARYPDLDECSVEVHFREIIDLPGPDAYKVVPSSQLVVARTAYKSNSSKYTINGRTSNFTEVQTLLKGRGIDLDHKRFLILQGEVESIALMKPKAQNEHEDGLLEYLEDIIGTSSYKEPIDEALTAMDALSEQRSEKLNRLRIVEREKNALEAQRKEALDYLRLYNDHVRAQSRLWQWYLWKCLDNEERFGAQIERYEKELAAETERNKDDITHLDMLEKHFEEREKAYEEVKAAAEEAVKDKADHEKQAVGLEERRKHASSKANKLKKTLQDDGRARDEAKRTIGESAAKIERKRAEIEELEANLAKEEDVLDSIRESLKDKTQVFHDQIEVKQKELQPWTAKINAKKASIDVAASERDTLVKKAAGLKEAVKDAQADLVSKQALQEQKLNNLDSLKAQKADIQKELQSHAKEYQGAQMRVQDLRTKASSLRQRVDEAKASQAASTSQSKVLDHLTRLKQTGRIDGFHGRLGSLGTIPDKYDVAVSTACGALNNMVVDTVAQGQACINFLRTQNVGRASFMVLEKLSSDRINERVSTPENVPRLFDLIKPKDPKFAPAFYKGVGNTLVANDLDQANRIAFGGSKRWRVVTLAGQLIDSSGTMSGGGNHVSRGGMSSKLASEAISSEVLHTYEKESEEASRNFEEALRQLRALEGEAERLTQAGPQLDMDVDKLNLDIKNGLKRLDDAEKRVRDLQVQSKPDARDMARINDLEGEIASSTRELEDLQSKAGTIESAIKELEKKIIDIGGSRLLKQRSTVDGIKLHINLANEEITKAEVAKAKAEKDVGKHGSAIESSSASLEEADKELDQLQQQLGDVSQYLEDLEEKVEAAQAAAENSKGDLEQLKTQLEAKREEIQVFRQKEMELTQKLNEVKKEAAANEEALQHWQTEHDKLRLEEIDDDEEEEDEDAEAEATGSAEPQVKQESGEPALPKKQRRRQPSDELHIYSVEELAQFRKRDLVADSEYLDEKLKNAKPNLAVLKDYKKREEEFLRRAKDLDNITDARDAQKQKYDSLRKQRLDEFMAGFSLISLKLKEMYQMITLGGNAELELVDSMDPFSEGIIFSVMPPKKSWKNISNLSGGEKTLSSLALVFALHVFKPTPLYFMDEIDAALDFRNVSIVANYIKDRTKNAQFIIISLRNDMFELSHRLIGIYKTANATHSIAIDNLALAAVRAPVVVT